VTSDVGCFVTCQEERGVGDIVRCAQSPKGDNIARLHDAFLSDFRAVFDGNRTWHDGIDADLPGR
jgi:hypothetical protein